MKLALVAAVMGALSLTESVNTPSYHLIEQSYDFARSEMDAAHPIVMSFIGCPDKMDISEQFLMDSYDKYLYLPVKKWMDLPENCEWLLGRKKSHKKDCLRIYDRLRQQLVADLINLTKNNIYIDGIVCDPKDYKMDVYTFMGNGELYLARDPHFYKTFMGNGELYLARDPHFYKTIL